MRRPFAFALALLVMLLGITFGAIQVRNTSSPVRASSQKDIVLILTDDQRADTLQYMPQTNSLLGPQNGLGVSFAQAFASTPLCCPSRASILSGLYTHNHGVLGNNPPTGGAPKFNDTSTIAVWLSQAGYRTGIYGKYLNSYELMTPWPYVAPGWTEWHVFKTTGYTSFTLVENGVEVAYARSYSTDILAAKAVQFIESTPAGLPLFLYLAFNAPHEGAISAPIDRGSFSWFPPHRPPSYNEADVSDKPQWVKKKPLLTATQQAQGDAFHKRQLETLQAVDRAVASIIDALSRTGRLANAAVVFASDNGLSWGEHRYLDNKGCAYEECTRVPLLVRAPGAVSRTDDHLILNIDFAPTFAEWAGVVPPTKVNGLSFATLLLDPAVAWRTEVLLEHVEGPGNMRFLAVRTSQYIYVDYLKAPDLELYDLLLDPWQLTNVVNDPAYASVVTDLKSRLDALKSQ